MEFLPYFEEHAVRIRHESFVAAVDELAVLLDEGASEAILQAHLQAHPYILSQQFPHCHHVFPKVCLGVQYETDFFCLDIPSSGYEWMAIELEAPFKKVITRSGRKSADLEHALQQIRDWRSWVTENLSYARAPRGRNGLGLKDINPRFFGYVVIGRRKDFSAAFDSMRGQILRDEHIQIRSWDGIVDWARKRAVMFAAHLATLGVRTSSQSGA